MTTDKKHTIGFRLKAWRESKRLNQPDAATQLGIPPSTYQKYEMDLRAPGAEAMESFARAGINTNWLLTGLGQMLLVDLIHDVYQDLKDADSLQRIADERKRKEPALAPHGFVLVPRYDVAASMGNGAVVHSEQIVDHLAFREEWVRTELGASPKNLVLISAIGDSMEPTLRAGDLLLVDRSTASVKQDAIYAFAANGELRVKRMQLKIDGSVVVKSDNSQYDAEILDGEQAASLRIIGRVVWSGRRM